MTTTAELNVEQVDKLDLTISFTMTINQWKFIRLALIESQDKYWTGTKAVFINSVRDTIEGMTGKLESQYKNPQP
jgi:hypothetical protein